MALNPININAGTIPYPNIQNGDIMYEHIFDGNNNALINKINELIIAINNIKTTLSSVTNGDSGADNVSATSIDGLVGTSVQQIMESLDAQTRNAVFGALLVPKYNGIIALTDWEVVTGDYKYQATVSIDGVDVNDIPLVGFNDEDELVASEAEFSTIVNSYTGGLIFKSKNIPTGSIKFQCLMLR